MQTADQQAEWRKRLVRRAAALEELKRRKEDRRLYQFTPNERQIEFANICAPLMEAVFEGGNQLGKTSLIEAVVALHATGDYHEISWYDAHQLHGDIEIWVGNQTMEQTQEVQVNDLIGPPLDEEGNRGVGYIPKHRYSVIYKNKKRGEVAEIRVKRSEKVGGGIARIFPFSYDQQMKRLQSRRINIIRCDEEPPEDVYSELSARLNATQGFLLASWCPTRGYTPMVLHFQNQTRLRRHFRYGIEHASHISAQHYRDLMEKYRGTLWEKPRIHGIPLGGGLAYPRWREVRIDDSQANDLFPTGIPREWPRIIGIDVPHGQSGAFAAVWMALDPRGARIPEEMDAWIYRAIKMEYTHSRAEHAVACMGPGRHADVIPCAFPHDAGRGERRGEDGEATIIRDIYRDAGMNVVPEAAYFLLQNGKKFFSTMGAVELANELMAARRLFIIDSPATQCLTREWDTYRIENGEIAANQDDHATDAFHKALAARRFARPLGDRFGRRYSGAPRRVKPDPRRDLYGLS